MRALSILSLVTVLVQLQSTLIYASGSILRIGKYIVCAKLRRRLSHDVGGTLVHDCASLPTPVNAYVWAWNKPMRWNATQSHGKLWLVLCFQWLCVANEMSRSFHLHTGTRIHRRLKWSVIDSTVIYARPVVVAERVLPRGGWTCIVQYIKTKIFELRDNALPAQYK